MRNLFGSHIQSSSSNCCAANSMARCVQISANDNLPLPIFDPRPPQILRPETFRFVSSRCWTLEKNLGGVGAHEFWKTFFHLIWNFKKHQNVVFALFCTRRFFWNKTWILWIFWRTTQSSNHYCLNAWQRSLYTQTTLHNLLAPSDHQTIFFDDKQHRRAADKA